MFNKVGYEQFNGDKLYTVLALESRFSLKQLFEMRLML